MDEEIRDFVSSELTNSLIKNLRSRRETFIDWPVGFISPDELAAEGLIYSRVADRCMCVFCRKIFSEWKEEGWGGCSVKEKHYKISPDCFNLAMEYKAIDFWYPKSNYNDPYENRDWCVLELFIAKFGKYCKRERILIDNSKNAVVGEYSNDFDNAGIYFHHNIMRIRKYTRKDDRLKTFQDWPKTNITMLQSPDDLAEAGFIYSGIGDFVACFSCGIMMGSFEDDDNAWIEHAKWGPFCRYLSLKKNPRFLKGVRTLYQFDTSTGKYNRISTKKVTASTAAAVAAVAAEAKPTTPLLKSHSDDSSIIFFDGEKDETNCASGGGGKGACKICFFNPAEVIFLPCSHMVACCSCVREDLVSCPICKENIKLAFKPYLPISTNVNIDEKKIVEEEEKKETRERQHTETNRRVEGENKSENINNTMKNFIEEFEKKKKEKIYSIDECITCWDELSEIVYLPCAHMINCASCALLLENCPLCREHIKYAFRPIY